MWAGAEHQTLRMGTVDTRGARTLLVVEDDPAICELVQESLRDEYQVALASDFAQAVAALSRARFDLVLADALGATITEDVADRWAILERIRELAGYSPVVIFTAHRESDFADFRERGFSDLLLKPFDLDELLDTVERNLLANAESGARKAE